MDKGRPGNRMRLVDVPVGSRILSASLVFARQYPSIVVDCVPFRLSPLAIDLHYETPDGMIHHRVSDPDTGSLLHTCVHPGPRCGVTPRPLEGDSNLPTILRDANRAMDEAGRDGTDEASSWLESFPPFDPRRN